MPAKSERQKLLDDLDRALHYAVLMESFADDDIEDPDELSALDEIAELLVLVESKRYMVERETTVKSKDYAANFLSLPDDRFRKMVRMSRPSFEFVLSQIKQNPIFKNGSSYSQAPVWLQLAVTLDRMGNYGNGISLGRTMELRGIGKGTCALFAYRVIAALNDFVDDYVVWTSETERAQMSRRMKSMGFKGCVGFIDGTTIPLSQRPGVDGECYFDRKCCCSLNAQVVCDDRRRIISFYAGWPGSCADSSVYREMQLSKSEFKRNFFSPGQYLLADSAYPADLEDNTNVPAYKKSSKGEDNIDFNTCLAHARVVNEHTIGVLKSRWCSLREIRVQIKRKEDVDRILRWISACVVLHNMLRQLGDEWIEDGEDSSSDDDESELVMDYTDESYPFRAQIKTYALAAGRKPGGILS